MRVLTAGDRVALMLLCDAYSEWRAAKEAVDTHGMTYTTVSEKGDVMVRRRPEVAIRADAWKRVLRALVEFGLTPASRAGVSTGEADDEDPMAEFFGR
jgi:P27 family predicted phage terminase small subunit